MANNDLSQEEPEIIVLQDEDGKDCSFELLDLVVYDHREFVALIPYDPDFPDPVIDEIIIMEVRGLDEDSGEELFMGVSNEKELQTVFSMFQQRFHGE